VKWKEAWEGCRGRRGVDGELWWGGDDVRAGVAEVGYCTRDEAVSEPCLPPPPSEQ
jgi:hypothetical protein